MTKKPVAYFLFFFFSLSLHPSLPAADSDNLEKLIIKQKDEQLKWTETADELPSLNLAGDQTGFLIYQSGLEREGVGLLCSDIEFDELMESNIPPTPQNYVAVNVARPRIQESIQEHCLIRPGDPVMAIGPGWQELASVKGFEIRLDPGACTNDPAYTLWATFDGTLPDPPYFYTTNLDWPAGTNQFTFSEDWTTEKITAGLKDRLVSEVSFFNEYDPVIYRLNFPGCDRLIYLKKTKLSPDDAELPVEILMSEKGGEFQTLLVERVDLKKGSGHLHLVGSFDMDHDPNFELIIEGDHQGCPYRVVFRGKDVGFEKLDIPIPPCGC